MTVAERVFRQPLPVRRSIVILLWLAVSGLCGCVLYASVYWVATSQDRWREQQRIELAELRGRADALERARHALQSLPAAPLWNRLYPSGADVGGQIRTDVSAAVASSGLVAGTTSVLPAEQSGRLVRHPFRIEVSGTADQLKAFGTQLRSHVRYLRIERVHVIAPQVQVADQNPVLNVSLDILGYSRAAVQPSIRKQS